MTSARIIRLLLLCGLVLILPIRMLQLRYAGRQHPLQLKLMTQRTIPQSDFVAVLHNAGEQPLSLPIGTLYAKDFESSKFHLLLTDAKGKTVSLELKDHHAQSDDERIRRQSSSSDMTQTIPPGVSGFVPVSLKDYISQPLATGKYTVQAVYSNAARSNIDPYGNVMPNPPGMPKYYWIGTVASNKMPFTIPAQ
jgi:hypothetical protein